MLKNILTLGPATSDDDIILTLLTAADRFRLNTSHMTPAVLDNWLSNLRALYHKSGSTIPVVVDLQGPKMRIGTYPAVDMLPEKITLTNTHVSDAAYRIPVPHQRFFAAVKPGDIISLNDAKVLLAVTSVQDDNAEASVITNGSLASRKGINRKEHPISFSGLSETDREMVTVALNYPFTEFALSFVHDGTEAAHVRPHIAERRLTAKIERPETLEYLDAVNSAFDELWLCRGDLGAQAGIHNLGLLQSRFTSWMQGMQASCFLAGQVLEHMTHFPEPTRSEVVHLYDIDKQGFHGVVMSDETAIGACPLAVAAFLKRFMRAG